LKAVPDKLDHVHWLP